MRIIAGTARGIRLKSDESLPMRPLMDRIKESLFGILAREWEGSSVLDVFAGTGSFGLEALSRGARSACFVDTSAGSQELIRENARKTGFIDQVRIFRERAEAFLGRTEERFDIIFLDPPFKNFGELIHGMADLIKNRNLLNDGGLLISRCFYKDKVELENFSVYRDRKYGENQVTIYRALKSA